MTGQMWRFSFVLGCGLLASGAFASAQPPSTSRFPRIGVIKGDRVRVRTGPSLKHHPFSELKRHAQIIIVGAKSDFYEIHLPPYLPCWIHGDFVRESGERTVRVTGSAVRLRGTPGTVYAPIGYANLDQTLRLTGKRDESGKWVQCFAPASARACVHRDYVEPGNAVDPDQVSILWRGLRPPSDVQLGSGETLPEGTQVFVSRRVASIAEAVRTEQKKPVLQWDLAPHLAQLDRIAETSEDLGEIHLANELRGRIEKQLLPFQADFVESEKKKIVARRGIEAGEKKEKEISRAVHRFAPGKDQKYLAVGWIVGMGKYSKIADSTHKLKKGNQLLFYLTSDKVDLDRYVNKRVGIQGTLKKLDSAAGAKMIKVTEIRVLSR